MPAAVGPAQNQVAAQGYDVLCQADGSVPGRVVLGGQRHLLMHGCWAHRPGKETLTNQVLAAGHFAKSASSHKFYFEYCKRNKHI